MVVPGRNKKTAKKRTPRTPRNMEKANAVQDPQKNCRIRKKRPAVSTDRAFMKKEYMENFRRRRTFDELHRHNAIDAASEVWRKLAARKSCKKDHLGPGRPIKIAFRPDNYAELLSLIPKQHQIKPSSVRQDVIYVPHIRTPCGGWTRAKVLEVRRHKKTNWILMMKPLAVEDGHNPYIAVDSTNVFLAPPVLFSF